MGSFRYRVLMTISQEGDLMRLSRLAAAACFVAVLALAGAARAETEVKVELTDVHNCCRSCCKGIKEAVKKVDGVKADTATPKETTFEVTGNFDAEELVKALNAAGYHVKVKQ